MPKKKNKTEQLKCIKSLYKSTYKKNAFTKGLFYDVARKEDKMIWLIDNEGREFNFSTQQELPCYLVEDYFKIN